MSTEDTRTFVTALFDSWQNDGDTGPLLAALADDLRWTVTGTSPISGVTTSKQEYVERVYRQLDERLAQWPVPRVQRIVADGDWAVVLWHGADGLGKRGEDYVMDYTWWMRVQDGRVTEVVGFYDDVKVDELFAPTFSPAEAS